MPDNQNPSIENNNISETPKKRSFFGGSLDVDKKDFLDFRHNTQEEIDKLNNEMVITDDLDKIINQSDNAKESLDTSDEKLYQGNNEKTSHNDLQGVGQSSEQEIKAEPEEIKDDSVNNIDEEEDNDEDKNLQFEEEPVIDEETPEENDNQTAENNENSEQISEENDGSNNAKFFDPFELNFDGEDENIETVNDEVEENKGESEDKIEDEDEDEIEDEIEDEVEDEVEDEIKNEDENKIDDENEGVENVEAPTDENMIEKDDDNKDENEGNAENEDNAENDDIDEDTETFNDGDMIKKDDENIEAVESVSPELNDLDVEDDKNTKIPLDESDNENTENDIFDESTETANDKIDVKSEDEIENENEVEDNEDTEIQVDEDDEDDDEIGVIPAVSAKEGEDSKEEKNNKTKNIKRKRYSKNGKEITKKEIELEEGQDIADNENDEEYIPSDEEIFEQEPKFFADDELSKQFMKLVWNARGIFKLERKNGEAESCFKIIGGKNTDTTIEYLFYLIEQPSEPLDLFIKKIERDLANGEEVEHLVQFSYADKKLNIFVDEVILYEDTNNASGSSGEYRDTKAVLEKFIFLTQTYYDELDAEIKKQQEERQKKRQLQNIFKGF